MDKISNSSLFGLTLVAEAAIATLIWGLYRYIKWRRQLGWGSDSGDLGALGGADAHGWGHGGGSGHGGDSGGSDGGDGGGGH